MTKENKKSAKLTLSLKSCTLGTTSAQYKQSSGKNRMFKKLIKSKKFLKELLHFVLQELLHYREQAMLLHHVYKTNVNEEGNCFLVHFRKEEKKEKRTRGPLYNNC